MRDGRETEKHLRDLQTPSGPQGERQVSQVSLGNQGTLAGVGNIDTHSLGDQATLGGRESTGDELDDDGGEVVDLASRYKTERVLGKGGMGEVLLAIDTRLNRKVAIKRMLGDAARSKTAVTRFLTEAQSIAALNHPNIVQIYDYGRAQDGPFLIMECVDGTSLLERCQEGVLPLNDAIELTCQLCDGLAKAHAAGIIHRDIKPANILLTEDGTPKLTDFGLAKAATDTGMTISGAVLGTLDFMSPEQRRDATLVDARSDLWSLAATLYQMLTGKSPKVIRISDLPKSLQTVLGKALEDQKEDRFQTAREFKDALRAGQATTTTPVELEEGVCLNCGTKNPTNRRFCRQCAHSLELSCLACSARMPMWENVCDACGAKQRDLLEQRRLKMGSDQSEAENLLKCHDYDAAQRLALALRDEPDLRLRHLKSWAESFLGQLEQARNQELARIATLLSEATAHQQAHDYAAGLRALEAIPMILSEVSIAGHRETVGGLRKQLKTSLDDIARLNRLIRDRIAARDLNDLLPEVNRLLSLQPSRTDLQQLRDQLTQRDAKLRATRDEAYAAALKLFAAHDYENCLKQLERIDASRQTSHIHELRLQAGIAFQRLGDLRREIAARVASKQRFCLLLLVEECLSLQPQAEDLLKLRTQLQEWEAKNAVGVAKVIAQARELRQQSQFAAALHVLEQIPPDLATQESKILQSDCQSLATQREASLQSLRNELLTDKSEDALRAALAASAAYRDATLIDRLTDAEFDQAYQACQRALEEILRQQAGRKRTRLVLSEVVIPLVVIFCLLLFSFALLAFTPDESEENLEVS
ncbi:MAG: serine/threonine-protein kinase [Pirellulales bacterium]